MRRNTASRHGSVLLRNMLSAVVGGPGTRPSAFVGLQSSGRGRVSGLRAYAACGGVLLAAQGSCGA